MLANYFVMLIAILFALIILIFGFIMNKIIKRKFNKGDFVFAKMKFFPPWPAQVEESQGNRARVRFLADNERWQWIHYDNITPLSASQSIRDQFYGKNRVFTRAVNELDVIREQALVQIESERRKQVVAENTAEPCMPVQVEREKQQQIVAENTAESCMAVEIVLDRLTVQEISEAQNGNLSRWGIQKRAKATKKERKSEKPTPRYNLRKKSK